MYNKPTVYNKKKIHIIFCLLYDLDSLYRQCLDQVFVIAMATSQAHNQSMNSS